VFILFIIKRHIKKKFCLKHYFHFAAFFDRSIGKINQKYIGAIKHKILAPKLYLDGYFNGAKFLFLTHLTAVVLGEIFLYKREIGLMNEFKRCLSSA